MKLNVRVFVLWVAASACWQQADAHAGLTIPVPRNNYGNVDPANWFVTSLLLTNVWRKLAEFFFLFDN